MSNPTRTRKSVKVPVIMYPEGIIVGHVRSGKNSAGKVRHVATSKDGTRIGIFDMYREAQDALLALTRRGLEQAEQLNRGETAYEDNTQWRCPDCGRLTGPDEPHDCPPSTGAVHRVWTATTPQERRHVEVGALVAETMAKPEGQFYAAAYGTLSALVVSDIPGIGTEWAQEYVRQLEAAMGTPLLH